MSPAKRFPGLRRLCLEGLVALLGPPALPPGLPRLHFPPRKADAITPGQVTLCTVATSVADPDQNPDPYDPNVLGLPDPDPFVRDMEPRNRIAFYHQSKIVIKNIDSFSFVTSL
jgi:hypothetical protein